jgi:hypothetical protein
MLRSAIHMPDLPVTSRGLSQCGGISAPPARDVTCSSQRASAIIAPDFSNRKTRVNWAVQGFGWLPFVGAFGAIVVHRASEGIPSHDAVLSRCSGRLLPTRAPCGMNFDADAGVSFRVPSTLWCERVNGHRQRPASTAWHSRRARMANLNQLLLWVGATSRGPVRAAVDGSPPRTTSPPKVEADNAPTARICDEFEPCSKPSEICLNPHRRT